MRFINILLTLNITFALTIAPQVNASSIFDQFIDPDDGHLDGSRWLLENPYGFLPVPIIITEPAIGVGGGAALVFFHETPEEKAERQRLAKVKSEVFIPPSVSVGVGLKTSNGTWIIGGGHLGHWKDDTLRYQGFAGTGSINLDFYGVGEQSNEKPLLDNGLGFNSKATMLLQQLNVRIGDSDWFLGASYTYIATDNTFKIFDLVIKDDELNSSNAAVSFNAQYQSLDNPYAPSKGIDSDWKYSFYKKEFGGDFDYQQLKGKNRYYGPITQDFSFAVRLDGTFINGDVPFYAAPYITMRGIPAMRYQAKNVIAGEVQVNYQLHPRWSASVFAGSGYAADSISDFSSADSRVAYGLGFRYLMVKVLGITSGLDLAKGPEDTVVYFKIGSSF